MHVLIVFRNIYLIISECLHGIAFAAGWIYGISQQVGKLGWTIYLTYMASNFLPAILACGIWFGVNKEKGGVWGGFTSLLGT